MLAVVARLVVVLALLMPWSISATSEAKSYKSSQALGQEVLIADENFVLRSEVLSFDVRTYLKSHSPRLSAYRELLFASEGDVGDMIELVAYYHSINPKVLLTLMEVQAGLLSASMPETSLTLGYAAGPTQRYELCAGDGRSLFSQIILMAENLVEGYYSARNNRSLNQTFSLSFADGSRFGTMTGINAGTVAVQKALAETATQQHWQELISTENEKGFYRTYLRLFGEDPLLVTSPSSTQAGSYPDLKLPWTGGSTWYFTGGPHQTNAVDFAPPGSGCSRDRWIDDWVAAARQGKVISVSGVMVIVDHGDGWRTGYFHVPSEGRVSNGSDVCQGCNVGHPGCCGDGTNQYTCSAGKSCSCTTSCSCTGDYYCCATGAHVHFMLYKDGNKESWNGKSVSGWTIQSTGSEYQGKMVKSGQQDRVIGGRNDLTSDNGGGSSPPPTCPTSGGDVILYYDANYGCAGKGENSGYVIRNGTGWQNVPGDFNDQASSVRIRSGWSVKLYENSSSDSRGLGGWACRNSDDSSNGNFWGAKFSNNVGLNDAVSSFEVFSSPNCGQPTNHPPNTPTLLSPPDGQPAYVNAPNLCWRNSSDPDGDVVSFKVEVRGDRSADSDWKTAPDPSCWQPSSLNGQYGNYNWKVRARDSKGAEAESGVWNFSIQPPPNYPPSITFATANGNSADRIDSRDRNWTFAGTASDPEGQLSRIEFRCDNDKCDNRGSGADQTSGANWSLTRNDMAGQNDVYFVAYDSANQGTASRHLDLRIDLAAPATTLSLNNEGNPANWPAWFTGPVTVRLHADDGSTGRARSGVREIRYRRDGGGWEAQGGSDASFTVSSDGPHSVEYYAVDNVGNSEGSRTVNFQVDQTPPTAPTGVVETHGVASGVWQRDQNVASFTWAAASDATSGLWGYQFYFGTDPAGVSNQTFLVADPRQWTPQPGGVRTGTYYLRGRTRDNAGNWSAWTDLFIFRYDGTPPENPTGVTHAAGIANDTWQRTTNLADFSWPAPHDEGAGVKDYAVYWGSDPAGTSGNRIPNPQYQSGTPLCDTNDACTGYLRLRSRDNVDNDAEDWTTAFVLRYDNAPPAADFTFREGMTTTQTLVNLNITASDAGSGVQTMRLSGDGANWTTWEVYTTTRLWTIPGISRQSWPVYLQVRDGVELPSEIVSHTIYLDVNPQQPRSAGFRLFDYAMSAGAGAYTSTVYTGRGTLGQVVDSSPISNVQYLIHGGYEAGSQALPIVEPGHDEFTFINGIFASGNGGNPLASGAFRMVGTLGEIGLPNNETVLVSQGHRLQPGFLAAALPVATPTPTPTPGPTPTPTPTPACEFPRVSINNGALFTNSPSVTLNLCAPWATEMMLSNDGGFGGAQWEPFAATKPWTITTYGQQVLPRFVYAAFREANGAIHATYFDDIIYDPNAPSGSIEVGEGGLVARNVLRGAYSVVASEPSLTQHVPRNTQHAAPLALLAPKDDGSVDIYVNASDDNSGLAEIQVSGDSSFAGAAWEPYTALKPWTPEGGDGVKTVYARFKDNAGNVSAATDASFALDTMPPIGGIALGQRVVGPDTMTTTVFFGAEDNLSGVEGMRVSQDSALDDDVWLPYTVTLTWPLPPFAGGSEGGGGALYVQYRDWAGNISEVYSDTYTVDLTPPQVYVEVEPGETLTRTVRIYAYDELAELSLMRLSNDPLLFDGLATLPYSETVIWAFDDRRVVWVQVRDSVGNWTEPYPAYAAPVLAPQAPSAAISLDTGGVQLTWTHLDANARYEVWRDTTPYFDPTAPTTDTVKLDDVYPPVGGGEVIYTDATGDPNMTYYYTVVGVNALGQRSAVERYVGVFRFGLTPGQ
jgi:murein DD-endopeptidase MepM/ murein hydrolase activator NlpD